MSERSFIARWFLAGGLALAALGLLLWRILPLSLSFPPYLATALLALVYGTACLIPVRLRRVDRKA